MPSRDASSQPAFNAGDRLGRYELLREIGKGGFASVWLARLPGPGGFEQRVAIKMIRTDIGTDPSFRNMFMDEARLAANIHHPNVVSIFELGEEGNVLFLVMEHVRGRPLHVLRNITERRGRKIPIEIVVRILSDTCAGLHAAHELTKDGKPLGVIHRDVSPQNVLVSEKGMSKLIDFGVAKANDRLAADTGTGLAKGKVRYMAPEQALVKPCDRRADIWSLGAVAYDLIEGKPPFDGPNDLARIYGLLGSDPAPPFSGPVPPPIERVVKKALTRDPEHRWRTAAEMRTAFERALDECAMRVSPDNVAEFFGAALVPRDDDASDGPSEGSYLRHRLQRPSTGSTTATVDVPKALGADGLRGGDHVETLSALSSGEIAATLPRSRRAWVPALVAVLVLAIGGAGAWRIGHPPRPPSAAIAAPAHTAPPATQIPDPEPIADPRAADPPATDDEPTPAPTASAAPSPKAQPPPKTSRPRTKPRPSPPSPPPPPPTSPRRRYDDTIQ